MGFPNYPRNVSSVQEILDIAEKYSIPLKTCRFFINQDVREPRAFGIYNDGINWIVYKNKNNGERAIRYEGTDEAFAAQQIWSKFLDEVQIRRDNAQYTSSGSGHKRRNPVASFQTIAIVLFFVLPLTISIITSITSRSRGYYSDGNNVYYYQHSDWYVVDDYGYWSPYYGDTDDFYDYNYYGDYDFEDSYYYDYDDYDSYDYDDDWDDDWDDWDSSDTDWDSDW